MAGDGFLDLEADVDSGVVGCGVRLLEDMVLLLADGVEGETEAGVVLPEGSRAVPCRGVVVGVGPGRVCGGGVVSMGVGVGDRVIFPGYGGVGYEVDGVEHLLMRECLILAVE